MICSIWALQKTVAVIYGRHLGGRDLHFSWNHQLSSLASCSTSTVVSLSFSTVDSNRQPCGWDWISYWNSPATKIAAWRASTFNILCLIFNHVHNYRAEKQHWGALYTGLHRNQARSFKYVLTHPKMVPKQKAFCSNSGFPPEVRTDVCITSSIPFFIHWIKSIAKAAENPPMAHMASSSHMQVTFFKPKLINFRLKPSQIPSV